MPLPLPKPTYIRPFTLPTPHLPSNPPPPPPSTDLSRLATTLHTSLSTNTPHPRPSTLTPPIKLTSTTAYTTSHILSALRHSQSGSVPVGRKIGFTNTNIWAEYNVSSPIWGFVWDDSVFDISRFPIPPSSSSGTSRDNSSDEIAVCDLSSISKLQPRIEPELVLGLHSSNDERVLDFRSSMSDAELLRSVAWIAPGFEIVVSPYKDWIFDGPETIATGALHARLLIGERVFLNHYSSSAANGHGAEVEVGVETVLRQLETFTVELSRNGKRVDTGVGWNVLGSPVKALRYLVEVLEGQRNANDTSSGGVEGGGEAGEVGGFALRNGEVVTTGTLTRAWPIEDRDVWEMRVAGLDGVQGVKCRFVM